MACISDLDGVILTSAVPTAIYDSDMPPPRERRTKPNCQKLRNIIASSTLQQEPRRIAFIWPAQHIKEISQIHNRDYNRILELHKAYNLLEKMDVYRSHLASPEHLLRFHSADYLDVLKDEQLAMSGSESGKDTEMKPETLATLEEYGLLDDCPLVENLWDHCRSVVGASLTAAEVLVAERASVAISWVGGRHHAKKGNASGFCYVNDIVLSILRLRDKFPRVLYIDLDIHHGDGVEEAFYHSSDVFVFSMHKRAPGFFPTTGDMWSIGRGGGRYTTLNIPLASGIDDATYVELFIECIDSVISAFRPAAFVIQCGADAVYGDPLGDFNLSIGAHSQCVAHLCRYNLATMVLGGGGYCDSLTARNWCLISATLCGVDVPNDIPEHDYITKYAPGFQLFSPASATLENMNSTEQIARIKEHVKDCMTKLKAKERPT